MTTPTLRIIGQLEAKVDALLKAVETSADDSKEYRDRIYSELEQMRMEAAESRREVGDLKKKMDNAQQVISELERWKERFIGMRMLTGALLMAAGGGIALVWKWLAAKIGV
ncbi:hypothetical protein CN234_35525 [Sinorhizobium meliloti]|uniref:hypothetical protein n=1 Tax=Rhizobium meliloti TaxID=382 RepID=UPI000FDC07C8|nr:hypothetical protein [Sinorhizobium meliloti]RVE97502.1 hypothetical protein CN234_35525 [Sinorhizobium meliloti]